jgi:hypothetical protein
MSHQTHRGHARAARVTAPTVQDLFDDAVDDTSIRAITKTPHRPLILQFLSAFKCFVSFDIPPMSDADEDYQEFGSDPKTPMLRFIESVLRETDADVLCLAGSIVLLRRMKRRNPDVAISINNMHRIALVSMLLAAKFIEDIPPSNQLFAFGADFSVESIFEIELEFLAVLDYDAALTIEDIRGVLAEWGFRLDGHQVKK